MIHASTQVPWHVRRIVSRILGISENQVRVIKERVGGGFGAKQDIVVGDDDLVERINGGFLDFDATDDRVHGRQEGAHFHGYYGDYCFLPL